MEHPVVTVIYTLYVYNLCSLCNCDVCYSHIGSCSNHGRFPKDNVIQSNYLLYWCRINRSLQVDTVWASSLVPPRLLRQEYSSFKAGYHTIVSGSWHLVREVAPFESCLHCVEMGRLDSVSNMSHSMSDGQMGHLLNWNCVYRLLSVDYYRYANSNGNQEFSLQKGTQFLWGIVTTKWWTGSHTQLAFGSGIYSPDVVCSRVYVGEAV